MEIEVKVPSPGESITQVQIAAWLVSNGDIVEKDQDIVEIDSDKATLSIAAEADGKISIKVEDGETVDVGSVIATIDADAKAAKKPAAEIPTEKKEHTAESSKKPEPPAVNAPKELEHQEETDIHISPLARKLMAEKELDAAQITAFFKKMRLGKEDVAFFEKHGGHISAPVEKQANNNWTGKREKEPKKMSPLRIKLAERLVSVKNETAMLTTFNEVNMGPIMDLRKKYKQKFIEKHGVSLGFMSFFTKAVTEALVLFPQVNAQIDGNEIIYHSYADIGIAVSSPKGLVVPVIRNAEMMGLAEIETKIKELATKAREKRITLDDMSGGTFTITNGGVFGSMLSTPIINPPQSAILGMHNIVERPVAVNGKVVVQPVMYLALSYDHRIIDGRESVGFLVKVKEMLEQPSKMLFGGKDPLEELLGF